MPKAPNGKDYTENDIRYLLNQGYTLENAIDFLSKDKKYAALGEDKSSTKPEEQHTTSTGAVDNKTATINKPIENQGDNINLKILEATNKTNELLTALLQAVTGNYEKQQQAAEATVKAKRVQHANDRLDET